MKVLHLTLKKKWFDMIASGEKKEEYREIKPYWISRLVYSVSNPHPVNDDLNFEWKGFTSSMGEAEYYDYVLFRNGYSPNSPWMKVQIREVEIWYGKEKWGADIGKPCFVIRLGDIIQRSPF